MLEHPVCKWLASQSVYNVDDPLARETFVVFLFRKIVCHLRILVCLMQKLLDAKAFVLWHR